MSMKYLGPTLDIHGGGLDLIFPHHENERAQSEAATGREFVRYWVHNGFVTIRSEKMSKSLGNFVTIKEILDHHHPEALRLFLLSKHYRSPLDYSEELLSESETALERIYWALLQGHGTASSTVKKKRPLPAEAEEAVTLLRQLPGSFREAMEEDLNTAMALGRLFEGVKALNRLCDLARQRPSALYREPIHQGVHAITEACGVLGIAREEPEAFEVRRREKALSRLGIDPGEIERAIEARNQARSRRDFHEADRIRDDLQQKGITLQDSPKGTTWTI